MIIAKFPCDPFLTNAYLVGCEKSKKAIIIDPAPNSYENLLIAAQKHELQIEAIFLTHSHGDHIYDVSTLVSKLSIPVYVHPLDAENMRIPGSDGIPMPFEIKGVDDLIYLEEDKSYSVGKLDFSVIHTPGHSPGGVCFYFPLKKVLFSGDTLFKGTIGRLDLPGSNPNHMWESLEKLNKLDKDITVYPGHGDNTQLKDEAWLSSPKEIFG